MDKKDESSIIVEAPRVIGSYEISPDGQRFLVRWQRFAANAATIKVVVNWID